MNTNQGYWWAAFADRDEQPVSSADLEIVEVDADGTIWTIGSEVPAVNRHIRLMKKIERPQELIDG